MSMRDFVVIDHIQAGQARPYADSIYSAYISKRREGVLTNGGKFYVQLKESDVRELARLLVRSFEDQPPNTWRPRLTECKPVAPTDEMIEEAKASGDAWIPGANTRWFVKIIEEYTD